MFEDNEGIEGTEVDETTSTEEDSIEEEGVVETEETDETDVSDVSPEPVEDKYAEIKAELAALKEMLADKASPKETKEEADPDKPMTRGEMEQMLQEAQRKSAQEKIRQQVFAHADVLAAEMPDIYVKNGNDKVINPKLLTEMEKIEADLPRYLELVARNMFSRQAPKPKARATGATLATATGKRGGSKKPEDMTQDEFNEYLNTIND